MRFFVLLVLIVALWLSGTGWGVPQRTEGLRMAIAQEMSEKGTWLVPALWGEPILTKPPGFYWALVLSQKILPGWGLAAYRMVSVFALLGLVLVAAFFWDKTSKADSLSLGKRLLSGLLFLPFCVGALGQLPSAEMDMAFVFWIVTFWLFTLKICNKEAVPGKKFLFVFSWIGLGTLGGVAILFKWTAPAFIVPAGLWFWCFSRINWPGKLAGTILCLIPMTLMPLAWLTCVGIQVGWKPLIDTIWAEAMPHLSPVHHTRSYPFIEWITFPFQILGKSLPAALPLIGCLPGFSGKIFRPIQYSVNHFSGLIFILSVSLLIWTIIPGHRPRHALPIAIGLVIACLPFWMEKFQILWESIEIPSAHPSAHPWGNPNLFILGCLFLFAITKFGLSLGSWESRKNSERILSETNLVHFLTEKSRQSEHSEPLFLGKFKDDGFVFLTKRQAVRWDGTWKPPGSVLCSSRDIEAFRLWKFAIEIPLLDQQGDPLFLLLEPK